jgi:nitrate reductase gamma subunit
MKSFSLKSITEKMSNVMIIAIVVAGTVILAFVNQVNSEGTLMSKMFLVFLGAIITFQLLPGLMLIGGMIKGLLSLGHRKAVHEDGKSSAHK